MSTIELKKKLIQKVIATESKDLLEVAYRLLEIETEDMKYINLAAIK